MRNIVLALIAILFPSNALIASEATAAFLGLNTLNVRDSNGFDIRVHYDPTISKVLYSEDNRDFVVPVLETRIEGKDKKSYIVGYTGGMSADPAFVISPKGAELEKGKWVGGTELFLPGNGSIYVSGHTNNCFNERQKLLLKAGMITEVEQPFRYVGLESTALKNITIFSDKKLSRAVANIPEGSALTVLLNDGDYYLLKTNFGLVGWIRHECGGTPVATLIKGLFFLGD